MEPKLFCQSCGLPIDDINVRGAEADGKINSEYCTYCYQHGHFVNPEMNLDEMKLLVKEIMEEKKFPSFVVEGAVNALPNLKRWRGQLKSNTLIM